MKKLFLLVAALLLVPAAHATTYYVSYSTGSNTNNGLTKGAAWKTHPFMPVASSCTGTGAAPSYTHTNGDVYIFMGGDTWPRACLPIENMNGGDATHVDHWTYDIGWFNAGVCGSSWCRPILDWQSDTTMFCCGAAFLDDASGVYFANHPGFCTTAGYDCTQAAGGTVGSYVIFEGFDERNYYWIGNGPNGVRILNNCVQDLDFVGDICANVTWKNLYVHAWTHGTTAQNTADQMVIFQQPNSTLSDFTTMYPNFIMNNTINNCDGSADSGLITAGIYQAEGNIFDCVPNIVVGVVYIWDKNLTLNMGNSYDDQTVPMCPPGGGTGCCLRCVHENGFEAYAPSSTATYYVYDNLMTNTSPHGVAYFLDPMYQWGGNMAYKVYFYNNLTYNIPQNNPVIFDTNCGQSVPSCHPELQEYHAWNNTNQTGANSYCYRLENRPPATVVGTIDIENEHCISDGQYISIDPGFAMPPATTYITTPVTFENNATATANGYTAANTYRPTSGSSPTAGAGNNLSAQCSTIGTTLCFDASGQWNLGGTAVGNGINKPRPSVGNWDNGAYQFGGSPPGPPPVVLLSKSLPNGTVGVPYSDTLLASGGTPPYTWSGSGFPQGLSLVASGVLTGTPQVAGQSLVSVTVSDTSTQASFKQLLPRLRGRNLKLSAGTTFPLTIDPATPPPPVSTKFALGDTGKVNTGGSRLNVRSMPSPTASVVTTLANGTTFTITGGPSTGGGVVYWAIPQGWVVEVYVRQ